MSIKFFLHTTGEALAFLCLCGLAASAFRWRRARRKDLLIAFDLVLIGLLLREYAVWHFEAFSWADGSAPLYYTTVSRAFLIAGAAVFIRGAVKDRFGEWVTPALIAVAFVIALVVL